MGFSNWGFQWARAVSYTHLDVYKRQIKPMLARGELRMVGATTLDEYRQNIEKDPALERRFQQVFVAEPSVEDTVAILRGIAPKYLSLIHISPIRNSQ